MNPIVPNIKPVNVTEHFEQARMHATFLKILETLKNIGYTNPVIYGGALRDVFLDKNPRDIDVVAKTGTMPFDNIFRNEITPFSERRQILNVLDYTVDFSARDSKPRVEEESLTGDAPINSIAMDETGKVLAHPDFLVHAKEGIYAIRPDLDFSQTLNAIKRFDRLSGLNQHWKLSQASENDRVIASAYSSLRAIKGNQNSKGYDEPFTSWN